MDPRERERYSRQILFPGIGERGQEALARAHAAIAGCGALGSFHAAALARAGVGRLTIIDRDYIEPSNLQRQWLFDESDAAEGLPKAAAAERRIARINSGVRARGVVADLTAANVQDLLGDADLILDGTDNFDFLISGVPNLVARQEWAPYLPNYHAESDVYDAVNPREAKTNAAIAAVLIWGLAENSSRPAPRQTRAEVEKLLRDTKLDEQMKGFGQWEDWVAKKRGVTQ